MTKDEIIRWALQAGFEADETDVWITDGYWLKELERFAAYVSAAENEACAKLCDFEVARLSAIDELLPALAVGICAITIRNRHVQQEP